MKFFMRFVFVISALGLVTAALAGNHDAARDYITWMLILNVARGEWL